MLHYGLLSMMNNTLDDNASSASLLGLDLIDYR